MYRLFEDRIRVHYGQAYVVSKGCRDVVLDDAFLGQSNGICGAGVAGGLLLMTGLHTGWVSMAVSLHEVEPAIDGSWEEIVDAPFTFIGENVSLQEWGGDTVCDLPLTNQSYMVRYCAKGFGIAEELGKADDEVPVEFYSLQFWPATRRPDLVRKQTAAKAAYWHEFAKGLR